MPPRKEPKEAVVYPASKRKPPPFKPLRPSKISKASTTQSEAYRVKTQQLSRKPAVKSKTQPARKTALPDDEEESGSAEEISNTVTNRENDGSQSDDLSDLPDVSDFSTANGKKNTTQPFKPIVAKRNSIREPSPASIASRRSSSPPLSGESPTIAATNTEADLNAIPSIPQPLLVRLLHERFQDKSTKIDKHAIQVVQKYVEIFVKEAIARTALLKREEADDGKVSDLDGKWLELSDLEKIAPGLMLDF